jgi:ubiquitin carboxyl-terminal hydrolase L3
MESKSKMWLPLEANPQVFTDFAEKLGFPTIMYGFHDVYALDPEVWLTAIPSPVAAVVLLY